MPKDILATLPPLLDAGTSTRGRRRKVSHAMQESIKQSDFYGDHNVHYMANQSIEASWEELGHNAYLEP